MRSPSSKFPASLHAMPSAVSSPIEAAALELGRFPAHAPPANNPTTAAAAAAKASFLMIDSPITFCAATWRQAGGLYLPPGRGTSCPLASPKLRSDAAPAACLGVA